MNRRSPLLILAQILIAGSLAAQPGLTVDGGTKLSLGKVYEGRSIRREFIFRNTGLDTLVIDSVRTSCGCTSAELPARRIGPRGHVVLGVTFDTKGITGTFTREIFISTNDTAHPKTVIACRMMVLPVFQVEPRYINFGRTLIGALERRTVRVRNALTVPVKFLGCTAPDSQISLRLSRMSLAPAQSLDLEVTLHAARRGRLLGQLELRTDNSLKPVVKISYVGHVRRPAFQTPGR